MNILMSILRKNGQISEDMLELKEITMSMNLPSPSVRATPCAGNTLSLVVGCPSFTPAVVTLDHSKTPAPVTLVESSLFARMTILKLRGQRFEEKIVYFAG